MYVVSWNHLKNLYSHTTNCYTDVQLFMLKSFRKRLIWLLKVSLYIAKFLNAIWISENHSHQASLLLSDYRFKRIQMLQPEDKQQHDDISDLSSSTIMKVGVGGTFNINWERKFGLLLLLGWRKFWYCCTSAFTRC